MAAATGQALEALVDRRVAGEPLEHLLGWVAFAGARYVVTPGVFVPRRRSELLVSVVHGLLVELRARERPDTRGLPHPVIVELCCGAGAVAAAVSARVPEAEVWAADIDPAAVACARQNLPPERVVEGDLYDALPASLRGRIDVVVVNAPYVPTDAIAGMPPEARDHEPRLALDGGTDGVDLHRRVFTEAGSWLAPGGTVVVETSRPQAGSTAAAARAPGLRPRMESDDDLAATVVVANAGKIH
jgi:release factor glutamine methyltransferase